MNNNTRVLIVDDEPLTGKVLSDILTAKNCSCVTAAGADQGLAMLSRYSFDLAFVDIMMPGMSGLELLDIMKLSRLSLPVIMITALSDAATVVQAMKKGAADFLVKPFTIEDVCSRMDAVRKEKPHTAARQIQPAVGRMDDIAQGVEALVDHFDFHGRIVTERTIEIARQLAIPEADIRAWAAVRLESHSRQEKKISLISGLFGRCTKRGDL